MAVAVVLAGHLIKVVRDSAAVAVAVLDLTAVLAVAVPIPVVREIVPMGAQVIRGTAKALQAVLVAVGVLMALRALQLAELIRVPVAQAAQRGTMLLAALMLRGRLPARGKAQQVKLEQI